MRTDLIEHARERIERDGYECPLALEITTQKVLDELTRGGGHASPSVPPCLEPTAPPSLKVVR